MQNTSIYLRGFCNDCFNGSSLLFNQISKNFIELSALVEKQLKLPKAQRLVWTFSAKSHYVKGCVQVVEQVQLIGNQDVGHVVQSYDDIYIESYGFSNEQAALKTVQEMASAITAKFAISK